MLVPLDSSTVVTVTGARGSGKTLLLAFLGTWALLHGKTVWSNFNISFTYEGPDDSGKGVSWDFQSKPLNMESLYTFDAQMAEGVVLIDEINLWADSQNSQALAARLLANIFQLIRKRKLSFYLSTQNFKWLNNRLRWQTDLLIHSVDLCHVYRNLSPGHYSGLRLTDMSGFFTGYSIDDDYGNTRGGADAQARNTKELTFHGRPFWVVYDTNQEFNPLDAMTRYSFDRKERVISQGTVRDALSPADIEGRVRFHLDNLRAEGRDEVDIGDMATGLRSMGIPTDLKRLSATLKRHGADFQSGKDGGYYRLSEDRDYLTPNSNNG